MSQLMLAASRRIQSEALYDDPVRWIERYVHFPDGRELAEYQRECLSNIPIKKRQAVRGPHGLGKSTTASLASIWFACTREAAGVDWKVVTTASAWRHLTIYLWPEIHKWIRRVDWEAVGIPEPRQRAELLDLRLKLTHGAASAVASDDPVNLEGAHADSILYVFDEAKAIPDETWDAAEGALAGDGDDDANTDLEAFALAISTPGAPSGRFHQIHQRQPGLEDWHPVHVTLEQAIKARRISRKWAENRKMQWGESSALYKNRVLGEFHPQDEEATIPHAWVEEANDRWREWRQRYESGEPTPESDGPLILGVDVATRGRDFTALAHGRGAVITRVDRRKLSDTMRVASEVLKHMDGTARAVVDSIGIGSGVVDRLKELGQKVIPFTGSAGSKQRDRGRQFGFANRRSEAWWHMRELLDPANGSEIALPPDDLLIGDLCAPRWEVRTGVPPKIQVEPKDKLVARIGRSTDMGDAVVMRFFADRVVGVSEVASPLDAARRNAAREAEKRAEVGNGSSDGIDPRRIAPKPVKSALHPSNRSLTRLSPLDTGIGNLLRRR